MYNRMTLTPLLRGSILLWERLRLSVVTVTALNILLVGLAVAQSISSSEKAEEPSQQISVQTSQVAPDRQSDSTPAAQTPKSSKARGGENKNAPEISTEEAASTFHVRVNLVEVRVVVRDAQGHLVGGLKKEDFQLLDDGKPQVISRFAVEQSGGQPPARRRTETATAVAPAPAPPAPVSRLPERYVAYLFDDMHLPFGALANARIAADKQLQSLQPTDRIAVYTTSGQTQIDFTNDANLLRDTLKRLLPRPGANAASLECPHMSYYMADMIENRGDTHALNAATLDAIACAFGDKIEFGSAAESMARSAARSVLHHGDFDSRSTLNTLAHVAQRLALMPGRRTILLVSPGFLNINQLQEQARIVERALHAGVVVDTLDARGLYTVGDDASMNPPARGRELRWGDVDSFSVDTIYQHYTESEKTAQADVLRGLAEDTGGTFFNNSNNLGAGFAATTPEYSYLLAFSPPKLKLDGSFHRLKVTVAGYNYSIQARNGYYAPKQLNDPVEQAKRDIEEAVFSQEESHDIPVQVHTEFFMSSEETATLSVLVRVDARNLRYRKVDGRNQDDVTVVSAVFDRNGKFIGGSKKVLQMRLKDETLGSKLISGLPLKTSFDVKAGSYLVRLVVRDDGGEMTAQNEAVEIP